MRPSLNSFNKSLSTYLSTPKHESSLKTGLHYASFFTVVAPVIAGLGLLIGKMAAASLRGRISRGSSHTGINKNVKTVYGKTVTSKENAMLNLKTYLREKYNFSVSQSANIEESIEVNYVLQLAAVENDLKLLTLFIDAGGDVNGRDETGNTPAMVAAMIALGSVNQYKIMGDREKSQLEQILDSLKEKEFDINAPDKQGRTPLYKAVLSGNLEIVSILKTYGADADHKGKNITTPLELAESRRDEIQRGLDGFKKMAGEVLMESPIGEAAAEQSISLVEETVEFTSESVKTKFENHRASKGKDYEAYELSGAVQQKDAHIIKLRDKLKTAEEMVKLLKKYDAAI